MKISASLFFVIVTQFGLFGQSCPCTEVTDDPFSDIKKILKKKIVSDHPNLTNVPLQEFPVYHFSLAAGLDSAQLQSKQWYMYIDTHQNNDKYLGEIYFADSTNQVLAMGFQDGLSIRPPSTFFVQYDNFVDQMVRNDCTCAFVLSHFVHGIYFLCCGGQYYVMEVSKDIDSLRPINSLDIEWLEVYILLDNK